MSGIEILGIAASVLQIADLGGKLSVKLFTFSRKIKNAHKSIDSISQDIAATGAILQQLGSELKKDEQLRLCSQEAVSTAKNLVEECNKIFLELNNALDGGKSQTQGSRLVLGWKDRLKFSFLEPQVDLLRSNLERLKSSLAVMLNVMIFAEQLRNQEALPILKEQRELIKVLVEDKETTQKKFEQTLRTICDAPAGEKPPNLALDTQSTREILNQTTQSSFMVVSGINHDQKLVVVEPVLVPPLPVGILRWKEEIEHHSALVKRLLDEASASHHNIDHGQRHRIHEGILHIHWEEWSRLRNMYNNETLLRAFSSRHPVSRFWQSQLEQKVPSSKYDEDDWVEAGARRLRYVENLPQYPGPPVTRVTADSYVDVVDNPSLPPPSPVHNNVQHFHTVTPPAQQSLESAPLLSPSNVANRPWINLEIPTPLRPDSEDPDEDSDDGLFSIPLSNKRPTSHTDEEVARPTLSAGANSNAKNVRSVTFGSPSIHLVPPVPPVGTAHQSIKSGIGMGAPSKPGPDSGYAHVLYSDKHQLTTEEEEEEDVAATKEAIKLIKQEDVSSTRNALSTTIPPRGIDRDPLSPPYARSESFGVVGLAPVMNLEESSNGSNLPVSKATEGTDGRDPKVTPATLSRVEAVQTTKRSQSAVALFASKPRTTLSERAKYQFEEDSEDDELDDEIEAKIEELSEVTGRLNTLARAIGEEVEVQNQTLERIGMKSDRVDGSNLTKKAEKDVVDDLLLQWTNLSTHELGQTGKDNWVQNIERLTRIR